MNVPYASLGAHRANSVGQSHQTSACLGPDPVLAAVNESLPLDGAGGRVGSLLYPWDSGFIPGMNSGSPGECHPSEEGYTKAQAGKFLQVSEKEPSH